MSGQVSQQQLTSITGGRPPVCIDGNDPGDGCRDVGEHVLQATHRVGQHLAGDLHQGFRNVVSDIGTSTRDVVSDVRQTGAENLVATRDIGAAFLKGICDFGLALQDDVCAIDEVITQTEDVIQDDLKDFALSNVEHQRDILSAVLIQGGKDQKAALVAARETQMKVVSEEGKSRATTREESYKLQLEQKQLLLEGRDTREKTLDKIGKADRRAAKATAAILLDACRNTEELSSQIDRCCCDLKLLVREQGEATRTLLLEQQLAELATQSGFDTWQPIITPDPTGQAHTVDPPPLGLFVDMGDTVFVDFRYVINTTNTFGVPEPWGDFVTLPIPPNPPFPGQFNATGTVVVTTTAPGDIAGPGLVATEAGGTRLNPVYTLQSGGGTKVSVRVRATYSKTGV